MCAAGRAEAPRTHADASRRRAEAAWKGVGSAGLPATAQGILEGAPWLCRPAGRRGSVRPCSYFVAPPHSASMAICYYCAYHMLIAARELKGCCLSKGSKARANVEIIELSNQDAHDTHAAGPMHVCCIGYNKLLLAGQKPGLLFRTLLSTEVKKILWSQLSKK